jgi:hypothetical protein
VHGRLHRDGSRRFRRPSGPVVTALLGDVPSSAAWFGEKQAAPVLSPAFTEAPYRPRRKMCGRGPGSFASPFADTGRPMGPRFGKGRGGLVAWRLPGFRSEEGSDAPPAGRVARGSGAARWSSFPWPRFERSRPSRDRLRFPGWLSLPVRCRVRRSRRRSDRDRAAVEPIGVTGEGEVRLHHDAARRYEGALPGIGDS